MTIKIWFFIKVSSYSDNRLPQENDLVATRSYCRAVLLLSVFSFIKQAGYFPALRD